MKLSINHIAEGTKFINITPILINESKWYCVGFEDEKVDMGDFFHLAFIKGKHIPKTPKNLIKEIQFPKNDIPLVRIHSECILGDSFHSSLCDCGAQLEHSIERIETTGSGVIVYLRQEGRGIGLRAKLACLSLQEGYYDGEYTGNHYSPDEANIAFGYKIDERNYDIVGRFLKALGIQHISLITGNQEKMSALENAGITINTIVDMPRKKKSVNNRQLIELQEKIKRDYIYPELEKNLQVENVPLSK